MPSVSCSPNKWKWQCQCFIQCSHHRTWWGHNCLYSCIRINSSLSPEWWTQVNTNKQFAFLNNQGLCPQTVPSKVPFIERILRCENSLFVGLSETWLKSQLDAELKIEGYTLFRCDTKRKQKARGRHTGGVGTYVRDDIGCSCEVIYSHASECVQMICLYSSVENLVILTLQATRWQVQWSPIVSNWF